MKVVVVSDSHSNVSILNEIANKNYDADIFYHLGDSELPEYLLNRFTGVCGNCDYNDLPRSLTRPRDGESGTYLILYLLKNHEIKYEFKNVDEDRKND